MEKSRAVLPIRTCRLGFWLLCAALLSSCASSTITLFDLNPAQGPAAKAALFHDQVTLSARYLDAGERIEYLREKGYEALGLGLKQVSLVSFALTVVNGSDTQVTLDPASVRLAVGLGPLLSPYNYAHLYMELPRGSDRQGILEDLKTAVFDKSTIIPPGQSQEKLLLFKRPEEVGPEVAILFERVYVGGVENQAALNFLAVDLGE